MITNLKVQVEETRVIEKNIKDQLKEKKFLEAKIVAQRKEAKKRENILTIHLNKKFEDLNKLEAEFSQ